MRCEQASFADRDIGTPSEPQVKHEIFFSDIVAEGGMNRERMLDPFLACSGALFEEPDGTPTAERGIVVDRRAAGCGLSRMLVTPFRMDGGAISWGASGLLIVNIWCFGRIVLLTSGLTCQHLSHKSYGAVQARFAFSATDAFLPVCFYHQRRLCAYSS